MVFVSHSVEPIDDGYRLRGTLGIHGRHRDHEVDVVVSDSTDAWHVTGRTEVRQTDFGVTPYSMAMGALRVADAVAVTFTARPVPA